MAAPDSSRQNLEPILLRVQQKITDYNRYNFSRAQNDLLKCFFDLAQEYDSLHDLYRVCVAVLRESMDVESRLYLLDESGKRLRLECDSQRGVLSVPEPAPSYIRLTADPYESGDSYVVPIFRKPPTAKTSEPQNLDEPWPRSAVPSWLQRGRIMGMFEISPLARLSVQDRFFLVKYANRIGYQLHNCMLVQQNIKHLTFINSLVLDIEHNVIIPNMYFRHLFNQLLNKIAEIELLEEQMQAIKAADAVSDADCDAIIATIVGFRHDLMGYHQELQKHHAQVSLFLESLFRREHFQQGHLVLHPKRCRVEEAIIQPQLEHYASRLKKQGVDVQLPLDMGKEEFTIMVDVGLLAQVYANLFSNAVKYTEYIEDHSGRKKKAMAYGRHLLADFFGPGRNGIKFNVFTTGPHLSPGEAAMVFDEGFRGTNAMGQLGTGHGLAFIRQVIEMHGGRVGYEAVSQGNNIYFVLPVGALEPAGANTLPDTLP